MKIRCGQRELGFALQMMNRVVSPQSTLPVLQNILMKAEGKQLYFSATNLEVAMTYSIDAEVFNEGAITVPSKLITNYVGLLNGDSVDLKVEPGLNLSITSPSSETKIKGIDADEFPSIPVVESGVDFEINAGIFASAIEETVFASSSNIARPVLTGTQLMISKNSLTLVSTDSYRLAERVIELEHSVDKDLDCIIPSTTLSELAKILSAFKDEMVKVRVAKNQVQFSIHSMRLVSRLIEGKFPDYKRIIPASGKTIIQVPSNQLLLAVKKVNLFAEETNNNVRFSVTNDGKLILSTSETQIGEGTAEVEIEIEGDNNQVALNARYLLDLLGHLSIEKLQISIDNKVSPVKITPIDQKSGYTHVIMPLKL